MDQRDGSWMCQSPLKKNGAEPGEAWRRSSSPASTHCSRNSVNVSSFCCAAPSESGSAMVSRSFVSRPRSWSRCRASTLRNIAPAMPLKPKLDHSVRVFRSKTARNRSSERSPRTNPSHSARSCVTVCFRVAVSCFIFAAHSSSSRNSARPCRHSSTIDPPRSVEPTVRVPLSAYCGAGVHSPSGVSSRVACWRAGS